ncbi:MAG: hypothetical protein U9N52_13790 [Campylobacterota bacterium]|nr:hypothetical protein [Campylobacterota bacterium]
MKILSLLIALIMLNGCGIGQDDPEPYPAGVQNSTGTPNTPKHDCTDAMNALIAEKGQPEEINTYDSGNYHSHDYWYWSKGYQKGFNWGEFFDGCETNVYTFEPI